MICCLLSAEILSEIISDICFIFCFREKQSPPSLLAQKHPHGTSPGRETHPHTGQPRPYTYGNDNSSVNRQSRVQSTRPDPVQGITN